jgi:hypothetical protein
VGQKEECGAEGGVWGRRRSVGQKEECGADVEGVGQKWRVQGGGRTKSVGQRWRVREEAQGECGAEG